MAGIGFTASWIAGLVLPVPNLAVDAPATQIIDRYGPHLGPVQAQFALTEGLPAVGLAVVAWALARAGRRRPAAGAGRARLIAGAGTVAALISAAQYALGVALAGWAQSDNAAGREAGLVSGLWAALNRLDGVKMLALAVVAAAALGLAGRAGSGGLLPRWLWSTSLTLAATITVSGAAYLFLLQSLAFAAYLSGTALLVRVTGVGVALGRPAAAGRSAPAGR